MCPVQPAISHDHLSQQCDLPAVRTEAARILHRTARADCCHFAIGRHRMISPFDDITTQPDPAQLAMIREAELAIVRSSGLAALMIERRAWCHLAAHLAAQEPRIAVYWVESSTHHARIVGQNNAIALIDRRAI